MRARVYLGVFGTVAFLAAVVANRRRYPEMAPWQVVAKSCADFSLVAILAAIPLLTPLLIGWTVMWLMERIRQDAPFRLLTAFGLSLVLGFLASWCLEALILLGVVGIDVFSGTFLRKLRERLAR